MADVPYANATSGDAARGEATRLLRSMGCESVGWMDDFARSEVTLQFVHRGRPVQLRASAKGWAAMYLRHNPWNSRRQSTQEQWKAKALAQGLIAINSILRDWVKGQVTAVECGILSVEAVFFSHMITNDGRTVFERASEINLLPAPTTGGDNG